jgi:hypothetical protein
MVIDPDQIIVGCMVIAVVLLGLYFGFEHK